MFYWAARAQNQSRVQPDFLGPLSREPGVDPYDRVWDTPLPESLHDDRGDKPWSVRSYADLVDTVYGRVSHDDEDAWHRLRSYYYNCIRDVDRQALAILRGLDRLGLADRTVVVYTSDHGEMAGAHGMRQKGPMIFRENVSVPLIVRHPDVSGGTETDALASPVDLAPTLLAIAGLGDTEREEREPQLCGVDLSAAVADPNARTERDQRGILLNYAVTMYIDPVLALRLIATGRELTPSTFRRVLARYALRHDPLENRGFFRGVFDGRYKFARYFAPRDHHTPTDFETLVARNDLELYDTHDDPAELRNLGARPHQQRDLLWRLCRQTTALIEREVGDDRGAELTGPGFLYRRGPGKRLRETVGGW
jgi:arylsulfatase